MSTDSADLTSGDHARLRADGDRYIASEDLTLAVRVAQAIRRPLLLYGEPGSGKSTLARYVAATQGLRYYEHVTTARTGPQDLLWSFDHVRRLGDAQANRLGADTKYVTPGALWWAFRRDQALEFAGTHREPFPNWNSARKSSAAVVLIDEIDKADPDTPNGLLVPLAARWFEVTDVDGGKEVEEGGAGTSLVVVTSNDERDLPQAFVRRCVVHCLPPHNTKDLKEITRRHLTQRGDTIADQVRDHLLEEMEAARERAVQNNRRKPSTAEFLDAVNACVELDINAADSRDLSRLLRLIFTKSSGHTSRSG